MWVVLLGLAVRTSPAQTASPENGGAVPGSGAPGSVASGEETETTYPPAANLDEALRMALEAIREVEKDSIGSKDMLAKADFYTQEAFRFDPTNRKAEYITGRMNRLIGRSRDAFSQVSKYVRSPEGSVDWEAIKILGDMHYAGRYYVQAEGKYRRAAKLAPDEPSIYVGWSRNCIKRGQRNEAVDFARKAAKLDPTDVDAYTVLAEALQKANRYAEAVDASKAALRQLQGRLNDNPGDLQLLMLVSYRHKALQEILRGLMNKSPTTASAYTDYVHSLMESSRIDRIIKTHEMRKATANGIEATQPDTPPELIQQFVQFSLSLNQQDDAIEVLEAYLEQKPGDPTILQAIEKLRAPSAKDATAAASTPPVPLP